METRELRAYLDHLVSERDAPGQPFLEGLCQLAKEGSLDSLLAVFPKSFVDQLKQAYAEDPQDFVKLYAGLAAKFRAGFITNAREKLYSLSKFAYGSGTRDVDWQKLQRLFDQNNELLTVAFAYELIGMVDGAASRAAELQQCVVGEASSPAADEYLEEACRCYYLGLFTACAVMCRSVVEEALERKLPTEFFSEIRGKYRDKPTLGKLLRAVDKNLTRSSINVNFLEPAKEVQKIGDKAAHLEPVGAGEALKCLQKTSNALTNLLS